MDFAHILSETFLPALIYSFCAHFNLVHLVPHPLQAAKYSEGPSVRLSSLILVTSVLRESSISMSYPCVWATSPRRVQNLICGASEFDFREHF